MIKKPLVGLLMEPFCQNRLITAKITYFSNEIQLSLNHILSELFEIIGKNRNAIGTAGAIAPPQKEESILVGRALTMETILCLIKSLIITNVKLSMI